MPRNFRDILFRNPASWVSAMASLWKPNSETRDKGSLNGSIKSGLKVFGSASENRSVIQHFLCLLQWLHMQLRLSVDHRTYRNTVLWAYSTISQNPRLDVCSHSLKLWVVGEKRTSRSFQISLCNNNTTICKHLRQDSPVFLECRLHNQQGSRTSRQMSTRPETSFSD